MNLNKSNKSVLTVLIYGDKQKIIDLYIGHKLEINW